jgi:hypothetical protein
MSVEETLRSSPNVVGFLYGHHHTHAICEDRRVDENGQPKTCTKFWEIETASLVEFPQEARMVRIKQVGQGLAFLEVSTFGEQLAEPASEMARYVSLARRGAERDHCVTHQARCSEDKRPYRTDGNSTSARLFFRLPGASPDAAGAAGAATTPGPKPAPAPAGRSCLTAPPPH